MSTGRLNLPLPQDTDLVADGQFQIASISTILDHAVIWVQGASSPDPTQYVIGTLLWRTDTDELSVCVPSGSGNVWTLVASSGSGLSGFSSTFNVDGHVIGEIISVAGNPGSAYLYCDGSVKNIFDYQALFDVIGTAFGGNGTSTFGLPKLTDPHTGGPGAQTGIWYFIKAVPTPITVIVP